LAEICKLAGHFREGTVALRDVVERVLRKQPGTDRLLIVADQWEELYTLSRDDLDTRKFIDALLDATAAVPVSAVLTVRGDFFGRVLSYRALEDRLRDGIVTLGPMNRDELRKVITKPAEKIGLAFQTGLSNRLLDDVAEEPGNLPLLEFVLTSLWDRRHRGELSHEHTTLSAACKAPSPLAPTRPMRSLGGPTSGSAAYFPATCSPRFGIRGHKAAGSA
jgi:hypothetical protein